MGMLRVFEAGESPNMKYFHRTHCVNVAWLHERLGEPAAKDPVDLTYTPTDQMAGDIHTKSFADKNRWTRACRLTIVIDPKEMREHITTFQVTKQDRPASVAKAYIFCRGP